MIVIDGLTPAMLEAAVERGRAPALAFLVENGRYRRAVSTFPSLTPVCLSSIATGAHPDVHRIPHLVWYHREERRFVEYGSSFGAMRVAGARRSIRDSVFNMNEVHLGADAVTMYEAVEDAGLTAAVVNFTCYRGRTRHAPTVPWLARPAYGPKRFFYFNLFESDITGAPVAVRGRALGSVDAYAAAVGRWLVTRDGFDLLVYYLPDYDFASHAAGPDAAHEALERTDDAIRALMDAAGGADDLLERYAVILCSDHGQTRVETPVVLEERFAHLRLHGETAWDPEVAVTASNRAGMIYRLPACRLDARELSALLDDDPAVDVALFLDGGEAVARRAGEEFRFTPADGGWRVNGDERLLAYPDAMDRVWAALANPNAGDVLVSPAPGFEFTDLGGRHHAGGGSHGSLTAGDSDVPMLTVGIEDDVARITEVAPAVLGHFGIEPPAYMRALSRVG